MQIWVQRGDMSRKQAIKTAPKRQLQVMRGQIYDASLVMPSNYFYAAVLKQHLLGPLCPP